MERTEIYEMLGMANSTDRSAHWRCEQITNYLLEQLVEIQTAEIVAASDFERGELAAQNGTR